MSAGDWKDFYKAACDGDMETVRFHVDRKINLNYQHPEIQMTALVAAIKNGHTEIAVYLLKSGADPRLESYFDGLTPLQAALKYKNKTVVSELEGLGVRRSFLRKLFSF